MAVKNCSFKKPIKRLFEDEEYIVFEKPSGLLVIPSPKKETNTLVHIVNEQFQDSQESLKLHPCHRLDKETSGLILFAKGKRHQQRMMEQFKNRTVKKKYIAFIQGTLKQRQGQLTGTVKHLEGKKFQKKHSAKKAVTHYKVLESRRLFSILEVQPVTGRTNQIRIQFSEIGHPLVGDRKYSFARDYALKFKRTALHACRLEFKNPVTHKNVNVISDLPKDMEAFIARNRN